jgi:hypothetical protein
MMDDNRRDELDVLVERTLRNWASEKAPSDRVWDGIRFGLQERMERRRSRPERVREWWADAWSLGTEAVLSARIILTPSLYSGDHGWPERVVLAGPSSVSLRLLIHH